MAPDALTELRETLKDLEGFDGTPEALQTIKDNIRAAIAQATAPAGWTHAETHAPDDPTQADNEAADVVWHTALPLPELLAAILRRAERAKSYGKVMLSSKDLCIDDVIRLTTRALLLANDAAAKERESLEPFNDCGRKS